MKNFLIPGLGYYFSFSSTNSLDQLRFCTEIWDFENIINQFFKDELKDKMLEYYKEEQKKLSPYKSRFAPCKVDQDKVLNALVSQIVILRVALDDTKENVRRKAITSLLDDIRKRAMGGQIEKAPWVSDAMNGTPLKF